MDGLNRWMDDGWGDNMDKEVSGRLIRKYNNYAKH